MISSLYQHRNVPNLEVYKTLPALLDNTVDNGLIYLNNY